MCPLSNTVFPRQKPVIRVQPQPQNPEGHFIARLKPTQKVHLGSESNALLQCEVVLSRASTFP